MPNPKLETYKNKATGTVYDYTDAAAQAALTGILDGTDIDSFADVESALADKVDVVSGKGLSTNDYDDTEKAKVAGAFPRSEQAVLGAKNRFRLTLTDLKSLNTHGTWTGNIYSDYGLTYTVMTDANDFVTEINVDGTSTASPHATFYLAKNPDFNGQLILNGCPSGSESNNFRIVYSNNVDKAYTDSGNGVVIEKFSSSYTNTDISILVKNGYTINSKSFFPMLRLTTDTDPTFVPYAMTNKQLTEQLNAIFAESLNDGTTFNIPYKRKSNDRNTSGLIVLSGGLYHYFIRPTEQSNTVDVNKILDTNASRSATATFANDVLTITFNATVPGGITLLTGNRA